jgi:hypothetical protein
MTLPPPTLAKRIRALHALMGSTNAQEAENAHRKLAALLAKHNLSWNDLPEILAAAETDARMQAATRPSAGAAPSTMASAGPAVNVLDLVLRRLELYVVIPLHERMAAALWLLRTYVFDRFMVTPRLALLSPVPGCGKTTLLILLEALARPMM